MIESGISVQEKFAAGLAKRAPEVVLFENPHIIAVNKPAGLFSHRHKSDSVLGIQAIVKESVGDSANIAHRLDGQTSGVMVITKDRLGRQSLSRQLENKERYGVKKLYVALLDGAFPNHDIVEARVDLQKREDGRTYVVSTDQPAQEDLQVFDSLTYFIPAIDYADMEGSLKTLTAVEIVTGRTHQIRAVARDYLNKPITGDTLYNYCIPPQAPRQMLHALQLSLLEPGTDIPLILEAPIPDDFQETVAKLIAVKP